MKKIIFTGLLAFFSAVQLFSQPSLEGYLQNDLELKKLALEVKKAALSNKESSIENGIDINLSTGTANFRFNGDDTKISFNPSANISLPQFSNLSVEASSKISFTNSENNSSDTSISLNIDLISGTTLERKITLLKAERNLLEAKRALQNRSLEAEKEYYTELKALFSTASDISTAQKDLYEDTVSFEEIKAKGYSETSAKYRQAYMKVISDKHEVETLIHSLEHDCAVFASKCGVEFANGTNPSDFLPESIPETNAVNIKDFPKEDYTAIEKANYNHEIASLERKVEKDFTLTASTGYTFKNSNTNFSDTDNSADTFDAGLSASYKGITLSGGVYIPTDGSKTTYSASASINPNKFRTARIKAKTNACNEEEELIAIKSAEDDYETDLVDKETELNDIKWAKQTNTETYEMYQTLTKDMHKLLKQGIIKETEYLNAFANKELYRFKIIMNDIDLIIYNNETKLLFCRDAEIKE